MQLMLALDIPNIEHVINYDLPQQAEDFIIELAEPDERVQRDKLGVMLLKIAESGEKSKKFYILEKKYYSMKIEVNDHTRVKNNL